MKPTIKNGLNKKIILKKIEIPAQWGCLRRKNLKLEFKSCKFKSCNKLRNVASRFRSSRPKVFCKKVVFIENEALVQVFSCEFCEISKNTFSYRTPPVAASKDWKYLNQNWKIWDNFKNPSVLFLVSILYEFLNYDF